MFAELFDSGSGAAGGFGAAGPNPTVDKDIDKATDIFVELGLKDKDESDVAKETRVSSKSDVFIGMATIPGK